MRPIVPLCAALLLAACADQPSAPSTEAGGVRSSASPSDGYIVVLREGADPRAVAAAAGVTPRFVYSTAIVGFAGTLNAGQLNALRRNPRVEYVEPDAPARLFTTQWYPPSWGIDRIDQRDLPLSSSFTYGYTGKGVIAYVLDTGVNSKHNDLYPRASYIPNGANGDFVGDGHGSAEDCHGPGSHVAGTIGSTTYGVAKNVSIVAGRVVNCQGGGTASMAIAGMDWIARNGKQPAVVNMSLGYGDVQSVRDGAERLVKAGFFVAAAAGNGNYAGTPLNACYESPAGAPSVMTVGATNSSDHESSFSNYGRCVDILAPGSSITSLSIGSYTATSVRSGTSMAAPHVAGVAAQYLSAVPTATPYDVTTRIEGYATVDRIRLHSASLAGGTPNLLLYTRF